MGCRTLILVRHGEFTSEGLTRLGRAQAAHAGRRLRRLPVTTIHCSTMERAEQTARIIAKGYRGLPLRRASLLRECVPSQPPRRRDGSGVPTAVIRRGKDQADRAYRRYFRRAAGRDRCELLVCHGNLIRYLVCRALALDKHAWRSLGTTHCGITVIRILTSGKIVLVCHNDTGHLPRKLRTI